MEIIFDTDTVEVDPRVHIKQNLKYNLKNTLSIQLVDYKLGFTVDSDYPHNNSNETYYTSIVYRLSSVGCNADPVLTKPSTYQNKQIVRKGCFYYSAISCQLLEEFREFCFREFTTGKLSVVQKQLEEKSVEQWLQNSSLAPYYIRWITERKDTMDLKYTNERGQFIKMQAVKVGKPARVIAACKNDIKLLFRNYYYAIEEVFYKLPFTIKKYNPDERRAIIHRLDKFEHFFSTDYTSFESSIDSTIQKACELKFYELYTPPWLQSYIIHNHQHFTSKSKYYTFISESGRRASGDGDTSLGNTLTNYMLTQFVMFKLKVTDYDNLFEGDDGLIGYNGQLDVEAYKTFMKYLGFQLKIEQHESRLKCPFLSMYYGTYASWYSDLNDHVSRLSKSQKAFQRPEIANDLFYSKHLSAWYESRNSPVLGKLCYEYIKKKHRVVLDNGADNVYNRERIRHAKEWRENRYTNDIKMITREEYAMTTGIDVQTQLWLEKSWDNVKEYLNGYEGEESYSSLTYIQRPIRNRPRVELNQSDEQLMNTFGYRNVDAKNFKQYKTRVTECNRRLKVVSRSWLCPPSNQKLSLSRK